MGACCAKDRGKVDNQEDNLHLNGGKTNNISENNKNIDEHAAKPVPLQKSSELDHENLFLERSANFKSDNPEVNVRI